MADFPYPAFKKAWAATVLVASALMASTPGADAQAQSPACQRLEAQLTALDRGNTDPARAGQIRQTEDAVNRQQFEVDRLVAQSRRGGCESSGFFSIFVSRPPQCDALENQVRQARANLERSQNLLEQLNGGTTERAAQRRSLLIALGDNGCGPQYRSAAVQQDGFFDRLFGNNSLFGGTNGGAAGTFRTVCVRTCDGYYFPISFAAPASKFAEDEHTCQRMCPAAEVSLYSYRNPGEEVSQAVSQSGRLYTELPTAFRYRQEYNPACSCRRPGQSWADALKGNGADDTVVRGDIVVTPESAKRLSQPRLDSNGRPIKQDPRATAASPSSAEPQTLADTPETPKGKIRSVGPAFYPVR